MKLCDELLSALHARHLAGESANRLAFETGCSVYGLLYGWRRLGLAARSRAAASKAALADPEVRARMSAASKAALADPEVRARMSAASKAAWADPEVRARMSAASKAALADPEVRARMSAASARPKGKTCVYCGRYGYGMEPDGDEIFACKDQAACEKRIRRAA